MADYFAAMIDAQTPRGVAEDTVARLQAHGATRLLWAGAYGGKRGHSYVNWDVRVTATTTAASEAVPAVTGGGAHPPLGTRSLTSLDERDGVLVAYAATCEPETISFPISTGPRWARVLRVPLGIRYHFTQVGYAALAIGNIGATVSVGADSPTTVESGLRSLVDLVLADASAGR